MVMQKSVPERRSRNKSQTTPNVATAPRQRHLRSGCKALSCPAAPCFRPFGGGGRRLDTLVLLLVADTDAPVPRAPPAPSCVATTPTKIGAISNVQIRRLAAAPLRSPEYHQHATMMPPLRHHVPMYHASVSSTWGASASKRPAPQGPLTDSPPAHKISTSHAVQQTCQFMHTPAPLHRRAAKVKPCIYNAHQPMEPLQ